MPGMGRCMRRIASSRARRRSHPNNNYLMVNRGLFLKASYLRRF